MKKRELKTSRKPVKWYLLPSLLAWVCSLGLTFIQERADSCKFSSDLYMCVMVCEKLSHPKMNISTSSSSNNSKNNNKLRANLISGKGGNSLRLWREGARSWKQLLAQGDYISCGFSDCGAPNSQSGIGKHAGTISLSQSFLSVPICKLMIPKHELHTCQLPHLQAWLSSFTSSTDFSTLDASKTSLWGTGTIPYYIWLDRGPASSAVSVSARDTISPFWSRVDTDCSSLM